MYEVEINKINKTKIFMEKLKIFIFVKTLIIQFDSIKIKELASRKIHKLIMKLKKYFFSYATIAKNIVSKNSKANSE